MFRNMHQKLTDDKSINYIHIETVRNDLTINLSHFDNLELVSAVNQPTLSNIDLPESTKTIIISGCPNLKIINFPKNLKTYHNLSNDINIKELNLPDNLEFIELTHNSITNLDDLPVSSNLIRMNCSYNSIEKLNNLPNNLKILDCSNNLIKNLDLLPENLIILNCSHNRITQLQNLPNSLINLICSHNELIELNVLPNNLKTLICKFNYIHSINLPDSIIYVDAHNNTLETLPKLNKYLYLANYSLIEYPSKSDEIKNILYKISWYSTKSLKYVGWTILGLIGLSICIGTSPITIPIATYNHYDNKKKSLNL